MRSASESSLRADYPSSSREGDKSPRGSTVSPERFYKNGDGGMFQRAAGTQGLRESNNNSGNVVKNRLANPAGAVSGDKPLGPQLEVGDLKAITNLIGGGLCGCAILTLVSETWIIIRFTARLTVLFDTRCALLARLNGLLARLSDISSTTFVRSSSWAFRMLRSLSSSLPTYPSIFRLKRPI